MHRCHHCHGWKRKNDEEKTQSMLCVKQSAKAEMNKRLHFRLLQKWGLIQTSSQCSCTFSVAHTCSVLHSIRRCFWCDCVHLTSVTVWAHPVINHISSTSPHLFVSQTLRLSLSHCVQSVCVVFVLNIPDMYSEELRWREEEAKRQGGGERRESGWKDRDGGRDEEKTSVPQMFIRIFITLELQCESLSDSYSVCVCVCVCCLCVRGD